MKLGKRFLFGIVAMICITVMACYLRLDGETILKLVGFVVGPYIISQSYTDAQKH